MQLLCQTWIVKIAHPCLNWLCLFFYAENSLNINLKKKKKSTKNIKKLPLISHGNLFNCLVAQTCKRWHLHCWVPIAWWYQQMLWKSRLPVLPLLGPTPLHRKSPRWTGTVFQIRSCQSIVASPQPSFHELSCMVMLGGPFQKVNLTSLAYVVKKEARHFSQKSISVRCTSLLLPLLNLKGIPNSRVGY